MDQNPEQNQATPKQQLVERVRAATNVLVTVRSNPSVDELSAAIGLTLMLNKLGKHATAVFSGAVPSTLEFLKPEDTLEQNTDSLRDFIVSLDKSKADKLRYKVEENVVKIFITPYRTSITQNDLEFTQGDFNVDVVLALGVTVREELDQAITAHGRILHDATVVTVTAGQHESTLGAINWQEFGASSLSEMLVSVSEAFQGGIIDEQMATAFLTGIVAETERFSNAKTSPKVMTMAAQLMAAGANQQLIANELQKVEELPIDQPVDVPHDQPAPEAVASDDGSLTINHDHEAEAPEQQEKPWEQEFAELPEIQAARPEAYQPLQAPEHQDPSLEVPETIVDDENAFVSPLMPSESGESSEPVLPASSPYIDIVKPSEDIFAVPESREPEHQDGQIHIDDHGNMMRKERPIQPHHKTIEPLEAEKPHLVEPDMDEQLANLSALLQKPDVHAEIGDVKGTDPGQMLETSGVPELDLPPLPASEPAPAQYEAPAPFVPAPQPASEHPVAPASEPADPSSDPSSGALPKDEAPVKEEEPVDKTLLELEMSVQSPHVGLSGDPSHDEAAMVNHARNAVDDAVSQATYVPQARADLNAQPLSVPQAPQTALPDMTAPPQPVLNGFDPSVPPAPGTSSEQHDNNLPPPPPIPPPMMPGSFPPQ